MKRDAYSDAIGAKLWRQELEEGEPKGEDHSTSGECPHCGCVGGSGEPKNLYYSEAKANDARRHSESEHQISLEVYPCPHGMGWHLKKAVWD